MNIGNWNSISPRQIVFTLTCFILLIVLVPKSRAVTYQSLPVVKPILACAELEHADMETADGSRVIIKTARVRETEKGQYCNITGVANSSYNFHADLPIEHWTQRLVMGGFGQASGCVPALNGEFAVGGGEGFGFGGGNRGSNNADPLAATWGVAPQARIDDAYMNNHMAALSLKTVVKAFYGRPARFSYMTGCSAPGLQVLKEAQRFPEDFDGYSIGAPPLYQTTHDLGFWHGWEFHVNSRSDGSIILSKEKLPLLHAAALKNCAVVSGVIDDDLEQPTACKFEKAWVECREGATDVSNCLTPEEAGVAEQLYLGPNDGKGHFFEPGGYPLGSELQWRLSSDGKPADGEGQSPHGLHSFLMPPLSGEDTKTIMASFSFTEEWFDKTHEMWPLFNAGDTDLRKLAKLGGKIILWNGAEDTTVQPATSLSYFEAVQKEMGTKNTDGFLRFFLLPGVGHCGGGDSANQVDTLTPLMAWVEMHKAPEVIIAGKPVGPTDGPGGGPMDGGPGKPGGPRGPGGQNGPGGPGGDLPYPRAARPTVYTRPIYPYPAVAKYKGSGDTNDAANYRPAKGAAPYPQPFTNESAKLLGPGSEKFYKVENNQLVVIPK